MAGKVIASRFELEAEVGWGGMGTVYRARDRQTGGRAAVKLLREETMLDLGRFSRECAALSGIVDPHVVRYIAHGDSPVPYLAMEWIEGTTLAARIEEMGCDVREAIDVAHQLACALDAVHRVDVIHRDLKPSNVMFRGGELRDAILIDFGVARLPGGPGLTHTGTTMGTPGYMAPEQAAGTRIVDPRADVFGLGCLLYECIAGRRAFYGMNVLAVQAKLCLAEPDPISRFCPEVPPRLERLLQTMLAKTAADRPTAAVVASVLAELAPDAPAGARRPGKSDLEEPTVHIGRARLCCIVLCAAVELVAHPERWSELYERFAPRTDALHLLENGTAVALLTGDDPATAVHAAQLALDLRDALPGAFVAVTCDRDGAAAIERGASTVMTGALHAIFAAARDGKEIVVDRAIAERLSAQFDIEPTDDGGRLRGVRR